MKVGTIVLFLTLREMLFTIEDNVCYSFIIYGFYYIEVWASLVAQLVKNLPAMWETWVRSFSGKDPMEKEKATHSSILA